MPQLVSNTGDNSGELVEHGIGGFASPKLRRDGSLLFKTLEQCASRSHDGGLWRLGTRRVCFCSGGGSEGSHLLKRLTVLLLQGLGGLLGVGDGGPCSLQLFANLRCLRLCLLNNLEVTVVQVSSGFGCVQALTQVCDVPIKHQVQIFVKERGPAKKVAALDRFLVLRVQSLRDGVFCLVTGWSHGSVGSCCSAPGRGRCTSGVPGRGRHSSTASVTGWCRRPWSALNLGVAATATALRWVRDIGRPALLLLLLLLLLLATLPATALALSASSVPRFLLEQLQELGHNATTSVAAPSVATTSFAAFRLGLL